MAKSKIKEKRTPKRSQKPAVTGRSKGNSYCSLPQVPERAFSPNVHPGRLSLIRVIADKWVNGTVLHFYFFDRQSDGEYVYFIDGTREWRSYVGDEGQRAVVRNGFKIWKDVGIGIEFEEVENPEDAEIRIGFMQGDGAWSYVGRYILNIGTNERTMNFGWDLTRSAAEIDTAVHEIGHSLGFPHEHQNPYAGIVWDEEAVYAALAQPPNEWPREKTYYNIIRKITSDTVQGSNWDPNSIMHYPFEPGLIKTPEQYYTAGLFPQPGLSERDITWVKSFYPPLEPDKYPLLKPFQSVALEISAGEQLDFVIEPNVTRYYDIRTFGVSDTVMVLFEDDNGNLRYLTADDDSGEDYNARIRIRMLKGRHYVLRIRLYYSDRTGETVVMMW